MTRKGKYILAGLVAATVGLGAAGAIAQRGHWDGHQKHRHMGHGAGGLLGLGFNAPGGRFCRGDSAEFADLMLVRIEHRVKPTEEQKGAFEEFKTATRSAAQKLREGCPERKVDTEGKPEKPSPIERLASTETRLTASLEAIKTYRPAAEKFYAALSDEQKAKLDRRGKHKGKWDRGPRHERGGPHPDHGGPGDGPDAPAPEHKG